MGFRCLLAGDGPQYNTGYSTIIKNLARQFRKRGLEVGIMSMQTQGAPLAWQDKEKDGHVYPVYAGGEIPNGVEMAFKDFSPDIAVHVRDAFYGSAKHHSPAYRLMGIPHRPRTIILMSPVQADLLPDEYIDVCLNDASFVVTMTKWSMDVLKFQGVPYNRLDFAYAGFDPDVFKPTPAKKEDYGFDPDRKLISFVGLSSQPRKSIPTLIRAASLVKRRFDVELYLHTQLVGASADIPHFAAKYGMKGSVILPEKPTMWGLPDEKMAGIYNCTDVYCMPYHSRVICNPTPKTIDSVRVGDLVLTHTGAYKEVTKVYRREYQGEFIEFKPCYAPKVTLTPEHPVLVCRDFIGRGNRFGVRTVEPVKFEWVKAEDLRSGDYVYIPRPIPQKEEKRRWTIAITKASVRSEKARTLPRKVRIDADLMKILAWYLSEGCITRGSVVFSLGLKDDPEEIARPLASKFGLNLSVSKEGNRVRAVCSNTRLTAFLKYHCGHGAHNKDIPRWLFKIKDERDRIVSVFIKSLWSGDGYIGRDKASYSTVSHRLAWGLWLLLFQHGIFSVVKHNRKRGSYDVDVDGRELHRFENYIGIKCIHEGMRTGQHWYWASKMAGIITPILSVSKKQSTGKYVYNLSVEGEESYATPIAVHNCSPSSEEGFNMPLLEAFATGTPIVATGHPNHKEILGEDAFYAEGNRVAPTAWSWGWWADPADLAKGIEATLEMSDETKGSLRALQLERAREFTWDRVADRWFSIFREHQNEWGIKVD